MDFWWNDKTENCSSKLFSHINNLEEKSLNETEKKIDFLYMYGDDYFDYKDPFFVDDSLTINVIQMACDTAQAKIAKSKPSAEFLTSNGDYPLQQQAKKLKMYVDGVMYANRAYQLAQEVFLDASIMGDGFIKYIIDNGKLKMERVMPTDIIVDISEAKHGKHKQMYEKKLVNKYLLAEKYPSKKREILDSTCPVQSIFDFVDDKDNVLVVEGWKLGDGKKKGRHIISVSGAVLVDEDYTFDRFPLRKFAMYKRSRGYWSRGIAETIAKLQIEINRLLKTAQRTFELGVPQTFVEVGSQIVESHFNNKVGNIVKFIGTPPIAGELLRISPELLNQIENLIRKAFEKVGLSTFSVSGTMPESMKLESGKAITEYNDTESERFSIVSQNYEQFFVDMAEDIVEFSDYMSKHGGAKIVSLDGNGITNINWSEVRLDRDMYVLRPYPKSSLSSTPAGRFKDIEMLINLGLVDQKEALKLLDFPDLESTTSLKNSKVDDIEATISDILNDGVYRSPELMQDLAYGIEYASNAYLKYRRLNVPEDKLEMLLMWIDEAIALAIPEETDEDIEAQVDQYDQNAADEQLITDELMQAEMS